MPTNLDQAIERAAGKLTEKFQVHEYTGHADTRRHRPVEVHEISAILREELAGVVEAVEKENIILRGIAAKIMPCHYCGVDEIAQCPHGFPGCALADDMMVCEGEQVQYYQKLRQQHAALREAAGRVNLQLNAACTLYCNWYERNWLRSASRRKKQPGKTQSCVASPPRSCPVTTVRNQPPQSASGVAYDLVTVAREAIATIQSALDSTEAPANPYADLLVKVRDLLAEIEEMNGTCPCDCDKFDEAQPHHKKCKLAVVTAELDKLEKSE